MDFPTLTCATLAYNTIAWIQDTGIMFPSPRVWFITGASTGFGYNLTCYALDKGDIVVATMRNPSSSDLPTKYPGDKLAILKLDVTDAQAISSAFITAREKYGRVDVVFNNAGSALMCELENTPEDKARALFDTNFWGAINVMKEAVKAFRTNSPPGGTLLQNSSSSALASNPGIAFYSASKSALESATEALAQELDPAWNIKITILESGPFKTAAIGSNMLVLPPSPPYSSSPSIGANQTRAWVSSGELYKFAGDPSKAVKVFYEIATRESSKETEERVEGEEGERKEVYDRVVLHPFSVLSAQRRIESVRRGVEAFEKEWKAWVME